MTQHLVIHMEDSALDAAVALVYGIRTGTPFFKVGKLGDDLYGVYSLGNDFHGLGYESPGELVAFHPTVDWTWAGPIIEGLDGVSFWHAPTQHGRLQCCQIRIDDGRSKGRDLEIMCYGPTRLVAFCRAYVSLVYRATIELPDD